MKMMNAHSFQMEQQGSSREQEDLQKSYNHFLKLKMSDFPFSDARHMSGLQNDRLFEKAQQMNKAC